MANIESKVLRSRCVAVYYYELGTHTLLKVKTVTMSHPFNVMSTIWNSQLFEVAVITLTSFSTNNYELQFARSAQLELKITKVCLTKTLFRNGSLIFEGLT